MTPENPLALDVATRTTRGRVCPRCGGKIIPSDRAVYQNTSEPDAVYPIWQCERCGYEEMTSRPPAAVKPKVEPRQIKAPVTASGGTATPATNRPRAAVLDAKGRPYPADVLQLIERMRQPAQRDG
jgi:ribosomal protein S27AE